MSVKTAIQFTVEITKSGNFGDNWLLKDIRKASIREAEKTLIKIIGCSSKDIYILGKPKVLKCIFIEDL